MVKEQLHGRGINSRAVLDAFRKVPRDEFVPARHVEEAYEDHPLSIGSDQTISQPYIVALMSEVLGLDGTEKVLEIGTGSGYQTAILSLLAREVYTVERIPELGSRAAETLGRLGFENVHYLTGDGTLGWREHAPYDAILAAAAAPEVPQSLLDQLAPGGRLVMPVGGPWSQDLVLITNAKEGVRRESLCPCVFVKLIGREGHETP